MSINAKINGQRVIIAGSRIANDTSPIGTIIAYMGNNAPTNYLKCDGSIYNINSCKKLAEHIKKEFGSYNFFGGDGETTFAVPDLRGEFLRGAGSSGREKQGSGSSVGSHQDATEHVFIRKGWSNTLWLNADDVSENNHDGLGVTKQDSLLDQKSGRITFNDSVGDINSSRHEPSKYTSRPTNTSVLYCIKYDLIDEGIGGNANIWYGTHEEYEEQKDSIENGTQVCFTDDEAIETSGEYYSETEQIIGTYLGKPLYRKVIKTTLPDCTTNGTSAYKEIDVSSLSVENCIRNDVCVINAGFTALTPFFSGNNPQYFVRAYVAKVNGVSDHINILNANTGYNGSNATVIIEYTKTTDSSVGIINGIRNGDNYSTTERVVGIYIDGNPIYQKTIDVGYFPSEPNTIKDVAHNLMIKDVVKFDALATDGTTSYPLPFVSGNDSSIQQSLSAWINTTNIRIRSSTDRSQFKCIVTVQYTKTTNTISTQSDEE